MSAPQNDNARGQAGTVGKADWCSCDFASEASIRRRYDSGQTGYENAKSAWDADNPGADYRERDAAMRQIAKSIGV